MALQDPLLPRQRDVVEVLVDRDLDGEVERVASARRCALGSRRRLDAAAALAHVLLLLDLHDAVAHLHHVDHLALFELAVHRSEAAAAARTNLVRLVELEGLLNDEELQLRGIPKALARLVFALLRRGFFRGLRLFEVLLDLLRLLRQRRDQCELLLQLLLVAFERAELRGLRRQHAEQLLDLHLLRERDAAKLLDVFLAPQVRHRERHINVCAAVVDPFDDLFCFLFYPSTSPTDSARSQPATARGGPPAHTLR